MLRKPKFLFAAAPVLAFAVLFSGCNTQPDHPNQINAFDGATYDSLTVAHGALTYLRASISSSYPKYVPLFNQAAAAYATAVNAYSLFRLNPQSQAAVPVDVSNLTVSIVALENAFQADMAVSPQEVLQVNSKAKRIRAAASNVTLSDILTELEVAAAIAETVPAAQPYAALASIVIAATQQALAAEAAVSGQPIDITTLTAIAPIG
jgi:hypothetical protein